MKIHPQIKNIIGLVSLLAIIMLMVGGCYHLMDAIFPKPFAEVSLVYLVIVLTIVFYRRGLNITSVDFDEKGFTFYDIFGKIDFCSWESIERVEWYFESRDHLAILSKTPETRRHPSRTEDRRIILVYTQQRYFTPEIKEDEIIATRDRKGRRIYPNARKSFVSWIFTGRDKHKLVEYLEKYRSDLVIERHHSTIQTHFN